MPNYAQQCIDISGDQKWNAHSLRFPMRLREMILRWDREYVVIRTGTAVDEKNKKTKTEVMAWPDNNNE